MRLVDQRRNLLSTDIRLQLRNRYGSIPEGQRNLAFSFKQEKITNGWKLVIERRESVMVMSI